MVMPILATKLFAPPLRSDVISRPRLVDQLEAGVRAGRKLPVVSAPAGFGKTTLLGAWIAQCRRLDPQVRVAWLSLEQSDNDPVRFLNYLVAAVHSADPDAGQADHHGQMSPEATLTSLINYVSRSPHRMILFLDDFQLIEDASVRDAVSFLLDHLPSTIHLAIASRSDPLLPLARLRAGGHLTELRAVHLRFTPDEAAAFLNQMIGLSLTRENVAALEMRTEGWIVGLQLAALSMRGSTDIPAFIDAFTGSNRFDTGGSWQWRECTKPTVNPTSLSTRSRRRNTTTATDSSPTSALYVSLNTMRTHTKHIFLKLEVSSRAAAVRSAESLGLI